MISRNDFLLKLLFESLPITCKYYQGDEEPCLRYHPEGYDEETVCFPACNCDGKILECDVYGFLKQFKPERL